MLSGVATEQIAVRLDTELLAHLDELVGRGEFDSRAAAVRRGLEILLRLAKERRIDDVIVAGYTQNPPTEWEDTHALVATVQSIEDEQW